MSRAGGRALEDDGLRVIPTATGYVQFSSRVLERRLVTRKAMKDSSAKSALEGKVDQGSTGAVMNEMLNDLARASLARTW